MNNAKEKNIHIIALDGVENHVHGLLQLHPTQNVAAVMQWLKGGTAHWINQQQQLIDGNFKWQDGYAAYSVSPSTVKKVINYIERQEEHHRQKSLDDKLKVMAMNNIAPDITG